MQQRYSQTGWQLPYTFPPSLKDSLTQSLSSPPGTLDSKGPGPLANMLPSVIGSLPCAPLGDTAGLFRPTQAGSRASAKKGALEYTVPTYEL